MREIMMAQKIDFVLELVMASRLEYSFGSRVDLMLIQKKETIMVYVKYSMLEIFVEIEYGKDDGLDEVNYDGTEDGFFVGTTVAKHY